MDVRSFEAVMKALNDGEVRYLLVGGLAVVAHGHGRMTHDIDLVIELERKNILRAFATLAALGYEPRVPIDAEAFASAENRRRWIAEKGMTVLNLYSDRHRATPIDLFVTEPFDFAAVHANSPCAEVEGVSFRYVDLKTLIRMKESVGRPIDLDDVHHLRMIDDDDR
jgi:predicted nucleotidyltransferase